MCILKVCACCVHVCVLVCVWGGGLGRVWLASGNTSTKCIRNVNCPDLSSVLLSNKRLAGRSSWSAHIFLVAFPPISAQSPRLITQDSQLRLHLFSIGSLSGISALAKNKQVVAISAHLL